ncbi:MAG TPA: A24 family peptidase, partial [Phycisphaerae bacterium]|nr:A24 family peptidase [Phycisphaerae bacterium]
MWGFWETTLALLIPATLYASWIDYAQRRVPNWLNAAIALAGLGAQFLYFGWAGVGAGLLGLLAGFALLIVPWAMHGMGAGDVKLMAAIGCWLGAWLTFLSFAAGALVGGLVAVAMIVSSGRVVHAYSNLQTIRTKLRRWDTAFGEYGGARTFGNTSQLLPYGVPLTAGMIGVLLTYYAVAKKMLLIQSWAYRVQHG